MRFAAPAPIARAIEHRRAIRGPIAARRAATTVTRLATMFAAPRAAPRVSMSAGRLAQMVARLPMPAWRTKAIRLTIRSMR
jgi:hypothetical protein